MLFRAIALAGGLAGAAGLSQFPEYAQQYTQRLAGAVQALDDVVERFDADAAGLGLDRAAALEDLRRGSRMGRARAQSMGEVLARHAALSADLAHLRGAGPGALALNSWRFGDPEIARAAWAEFRPAVPVSGAGIGFGAAGFVLGYGLIGGALAGLGALMRPGRRRRPAAPGARP
ncbi:Protein of unknown function (DUF2937) [Roseovarius halotolerans]|uniref:DUF2937 domain-containing protein n=1 Tax=Roseovarius halotolerans TaxID=505353 RepID=A0A1X6ZDT6_9RHOB|nr:DUF2937 family protein [Roseovarius halotolerans]RKT30736.1 Protein of unknown function (DUF2937) [Roseovarius halotolerans]SLN48814.1 hypothetical protein ROH8110_02623 [Roseovarius halotolerans]